MDQAANPSGLQSDYAEYEASCVCMKNVFSKFKRMQYFS